MPKSLTVAVEPTVLRWLRESSGWSIEEAGKKLKITPNMMQDMESGKISPTLSQIRTLSSAYKYPLASFFLSEPKEQKPLPKDYRMLPHRKDVFDKKTIWAIRRSRRLQGIGLELSQNISGGTELKVNNIGLRDEPKDVAARWREMFDLSFEKQKKIKDAYKLFGYLRDTLENLNLLVFQFSMPIEDARGFALADENPSVIVVNSKDRIEARIFTLMHEFGHILLGETTIGTPDAAHATRNSVERWCNVFASSFLLPDSEAVKLFRDKHSQLTETETLNMLSKKYKVSKAVLLRKMLDLRYISRSQFKNVLDRYALKNQNVAEPKARPIVTPDTKCLSEVGNKFASLVAINFDKNLITYTDALSYLSAKSGNIEKVLAKARA